MAVEQPAQHWARHQSGASNEALTRHLNHRGRRDRRSSHVLFGGRQLRRSDCARLPLAVGEHPLLLRPEGVRAAQRHQAPADLRSPPRRLRNAAAASLRCGRLARLRAWCERQADALLHRQPQLRDPPCLHDARLREERAARPIHLQLAHHRRLHQCKRFQLSRFRNSGLRRGRLRKIIVVKRGKTDTRYLPPASAPTAGASTSRSGERPKDAPERAPSSNYRTSSLTFGEAHGARLRDSRNRKLQGSSRHSMNSRLTGLSQSGRS